ncbi:hypothetical protein WJX73_000436 [Symbiochloris irregularis]|uniref:LAGLIDADG homing endonuclease n=1 Tax=Symbiochloris irregularis TaxID=706552 RepID=A0AAW1PMV4_9CHLO
MSQSRVCMNADSTEQRKWTPHSYLRHLSAALLKAVCDNMRSGTRPVDKAKALPCSILSFLMAENTDNFAIRCLQHLHHTIILAGLLAHARAEAPTGKVAWWFCTSNRRKPVSAALADGQLSIQVHD